MREGRANFSMREGGGANFSMRERGGGGRTLAGERGGAMCNIYIFLVKFAS